MPIVQTRQPREVDENQGDKKENDNSYTWIGGWMTAQPASIPL